MEPRELLTALLELAARADLEVRVLSASGSRSGAEAEFRPRESSSCRLGDRVWVVLAPDDPPMHQARVLAGALAHFRSGFLEEVFMAPGVRSFIESL